ncbi:hypothetical protein BLNAU_24118 [Blattamonas nauphoetae]|uniref:Uncharacterized protein n=1 Tax=Blattamonas nauphoetae TaxID=2049346 RepID=A0ABQ9WNC8_9EUKA|nr:hypothetical protein BLNAU_24118 [Blattamonas nauphoetae]
MGDFAKSGVELPVGPPIHENARTLSIERVSVEHSEKRAVSADVCCCGEVNGVTVQRGAHTDQERQSRGEVVRVVAVFITGSSLLASFIRERIACVGISRPVPTKSHPSSDCLFEKCSGDGQDASQAISAFIRGMASRSICSTFQHSSSIFSENQLLVIHNQHSQSYSLSTVIIHQDSSQFISVVSDRSRLDRNRIACVTEDFLNPIIPQIFGVFDDV